MPTYVIPADADCLAACGCSSVCCVTAKFKFWIVNRTGYGFAMGLEYVTWEIYQGNTLIETGQRRINSIDSTWDLPSGTGGLDFLGSVSLSPTMWGAMPVGTQGTVQIELTNTRWCQANSRLCGEDGTRPIYFLSSAPATLNESIPSVAAPSDPSGYPWENDNDPTVLKYAVTSEMTVELCR